MGSKEEAFCLRGKNARFALLQCNNRLENKNAGEAVGPLPRFTFAWVAAI
jgi:hypothetical protein